MIFSLGKNRNRETAASGLGNLKPSLARHRLGLDDIALGIVAVMSIFAVTIDRGCKFAVFGQEAEVDDSLTGLGAVSATDKPAVGTTRLAGYSQIFHRLGLEIVALIPVEVDILDKLEGIGEALVIFGEIGRHLQRARHRHVERQLVGQRRVAPRFVFGINL